jgi:hypothetical protein
MEYGKFYNGIGISRKIQNAWDNLENCDVHSDIGSLLCQRTLTKKSGSVITEACYQAVVPNGDTYYFSKTSGKIWKRAIADGSYSFVRTGVNGAYKGCTYYRNYLYYTMDAFLGRYDFGSVAGSPSTSPLRFYFISSLVFVVVSSSVSASVSYASASSTAHSISSPSAGTPSWNDNFNVLTSGYPHPMFQFDLILYIGNSNTVASLDDAGVFSNNVLDLPVEFYALLIIIDFSKLWKLHK